MQLKKIIFGLTKNALKQTYKKFNLYLLLEDLLIIAFKSLSWLDVRFKINLENYKAKHCTPEGAQENL